MIDKDYKRVRLPKGLKRAVVIEKSKDHPIRENDYDKVLESDFDAHRATYRTVWMYGVPVLVKVEPDEPSTK